MMLHFHKYLLVFALFLALSCSKKEHNSFTFVQLCDTQLGMGGYNHDIETFNQAVKQINSLNPDFVLICGDLVNDATDSSYADFKNIRDKFNIPCYCAPGNHDVGNIPNDSTLSFYRKTIGKDYYKIENKGFSFVVTNSLLWKEDIINESEKHNDWFKEMLKSIKSKKQPIFIVGHYPLFVNNIEEQEGYFNFPLEKRKELLNLFDQNNVVAYLSGHAHKPLINNYKSIQLVSGEATSKNLDSVSDLGFRIWEVSNDTIMQHFVSLQKPFNENPMN